MPPGLGSGGMTPVILASTSPTRLRVLRAAGLRPEVIPSEVDETSVTRDRPRDLTLALAEAKAAAVAQRVEAGVVIGCDSLLEMASPRGARRAAAGQARLGSAGTGTVAADGRADRHPVHRPLRHRR